MFKPYLLLAGVALLFAGTVQADSPEAQAKQASTAIAKQEAAAPAADRSARNVAARPATNEANQELHPDARPVYLNGGHFGGGE